MNPRFTAILIGVMVVATFITGIVVYPHLPLTVASHWNVSGQVNGHLPRFWGAFLLPTMMLVLYGFWALIPRIDPINPGFKGFRHVYDFFWILLTAFLAYVYALTLGMNFGWSFDIRAIVPALGILFIALGALLPYTKRNWFFGIRTPWTLSSEAVWDKTHTFGGRLFIAAGAIIFIGVTSPARSILWFILVPLLAAALASVVYSYMLYKRER